MLVRTHTYKGDSFKVFHHEDVLNKLPKGTLYFNGRHWAYKGFRSYNLFHILHLPNHIKGTYLTSAPLNEESVLFLASFIRPDDKNKFLKVLLSKFPQFYSVVYNLYYPDKKLPDEFVIPDLKCAVLVNDVRHLQKLQKKLLSSSVKDISEKGNKLCNMYSNREDYNKDIDKGIIHRRNTKFLVPFSFLINLFGKHTIIKNILVKYDILSQDYVRGMNVRLESGTVWLIPIDYIKLNQTIMQLLKQISDTDTPTDMDTISTDSDINTSVDVDTPIDTNVDTSKESMQIEDIDDNIEENVTKENVTEENIIKPISVKEPVGLDVYILNKDTNAFIHLSNCTKIDILKTVVEQNTSNVLVLTKSDTDKSFQNLQLLR